MLHLVYGMNSPLISVSLVRHSLLHFLLSHMAVHHLRHLHYLASSLTRSVFHSELKLGSSANPFHLYLSYRTDYTVSQTI